jgi:signal transduction histidine kinase
MKNSVKSDDSHKINRLKDELRLARRTKRQLVERLKHEQDRGKVKSLFVNMISHEMRSPLAVIQGIADLLDVHNDKLSKSDVRSYARLIKKSVVRMTHTMDDILIFGKVQNNQLVFQPLKADVIKFCQGVIGDVENLYEDRQVVLELAEKFPRELSIDTALLYHIISNLLSNAIKYSDNDTMVFLRLSLVSDRVIIHVKDSGIGIPSEEIGTIFNLFQRGSNIANRKGIGIGMFIVQHCVALHGGSIDVTSEKDVGTTFRLILPVDR